ncbi:WXG100 family type VII secretion target [Lentzea rhizosphaerae]|uniref:WXG100 family type VII secretion target n=1 Tax=Lentzea rhizosphaerae TaxID=2041025 RepID=A0ABV8BRS5_9PSEU
MPSWEEVKKLCDNPEVPIDQKKALLEAYYAKDAEGNVLGGTHNDELERYLDDYDISWGDGAWQSFKNDMPWADSSEDRLNNAYDVAKKSGDAGQKKIDDHNNAKKSGQDTLNQSEQRAADGGAGVANSNQLLDAGMPGLKYFENFLPVYQQAKAAYLVDGNFNTDFNNAKTLYEEQRDIDFHKIDQDIIEMRQISKDLRTQQADSEKSMGKLWSTWDGKAADNSRTFVADFSKKAAAVADSVNHIADATRAACHTVSQLVNDKADAVLNGVGSPFDIAGKTPPQISEIIQAADSQDEGLLRRVAGHVGVDINDEACDGDKWKGEVTKGARQWLKATFHTDVNTKFTNFEKLCKDTKKAVDDAWNLLTAEIDKINTKPFEPAKEEKPADKPGDDTGGGGKKPGGGGPGGGPGGGGPGGGGPGGGGMPEVPKPENPLDKNGDGKPDIPGDTDGDGKVDDLDGDGKPDDKDGDGKPDQPKPEEKLESVTVKAGDNTIKVTEPDSNGHVKMTIDTPKGEPKTYDLDFSKNPEAAKALMGQNGTQAITAMANQLTGTPAPGSQAPGAPGATAGNTPAPGGGTPGGAGMGAPGSESNPIPVEVGADGKIHIEQDGVNFTAEVNAETGEINLTADNGDGTPDQIGVSFGEDDNPAAGTDPAGDTGRGGGGGMTGDLRLDDPLTLPDQAFPQAPDGQFQTMPAPAQGEFQAMPAHADFQTTPAQAEQVWSPPGQESPNVAERFQESVGRSYIQDNGFMPGVGEPRISGEGVQFAHAAASDTTSTSGVSFTGGGGGSGSESVLGGSAPADSAWSTPSQSDPNGNSAGFDTNASEAGQAGSANLPSLQDAHGQPTSGAATGGMMGGGMMGGGMPSAGAGAGGQQGGDTERGASQWRTTGSLFDEDNNNPLSGAQGVLSGDDGNRGGGW